jgi:hypothetical protein
MTKKQQKPVSVNPLENNNMEKQQNYLQISEQIFQITLRERVTR